MTTQPPKDMPQWFADHLEIEKKHYDETMAMLKPISETYETVARLGKWAKVGLGVILLLLSIAVAVKNLWPKF
jgi:hypothetical protein